MVFLSRNFYCLLVSALVLCCIDNLMCLPVHAQQNSTTSGREFYISFLPNFHNNIANKNKNLRDSLYIFCSGPPFTSVIIRSRDFNGNTENTEVIISEKGIAQFGVPWVDFEPEGFNESGRKFVLGDNGKKILPYFHVVSPEDISVYALNQAVTTSDASLIYPVSSLGKNYFLLSYPSSGVLVKDTLAYHSTPSQGIITATEDNTLITIYPTADLVNQFDFSGEYSRKIDISLNKGESYLLQTLIEKENLRRDISGTYIESNKPIAVFAGHQRSGAPRVISETGLSRDHLYEQVPPIEQWGYKFQVIPFPKGTIEFPTYSEVRILASEDSTFLTIGDKVLDTLQKGEIVDLKLDNAFVISSSNPILVAAIKSSTQSDKHSEGIGDPLLIYIPPYNQYQKVYTVCNIQGHGTFSSSSDVAFTEQYISIVSPRAGLATLRLDGSPIDSALIRTISTNNSSDFCDYVYAIAAVSEGTHTLRGTLPFATYVYGYGNANSYGYVGGIGTQPIRKPSVFQKSNDTTVCKGNVANIILKGGKKYRWLSSKFISCDTCSETKVTPDTTVTLYVEVTNYYDCTFLDSVSIKVSNIELTMPKDTTVCLGSAITLTTKGGSTYKWRKDETLSCDTCQTTVAVPYKPKHTYYLTTSNNYGCSITDSVTLTTIPVIVSTQNDTVICRGQSLVLKAQGAKNYKWSPSKGLECDTCQTTIVRPESTTQYIVTGYINDECKSTDTVVITVSSLSINVQDDTTICKGSSVSLTANASENTYRWKPSMSLSCDTCSTTLATPDKTTMYYVETYNEHCSGIDSVLVTVVNFQPIVSNDTIICKGDSVKLTVSKAARYTWSPSNSLSCSTCQNPTAFPQETTTYVCKTESAEMCTDFDTVRVFIRPCKPVDTIVFKPTLTCDSNTISYTIFNTKNAPPNRTFSIVSFTGDETVFQRIQPAKPTVQMNFGDSLTFTIRFIPKDARSYEGYFTCMFDDGEEFILNVRGLGRYSVVELKTSDTSEIFPGSFIYTTVSSKSNSWDVSGLTDIDIFIKYLSRALVFNELRKDKGVLNEWTLSPTVVNHQDTTILSVRCIGKKPIEKDGDLFSVSFKTLLFDQPIAEIISTGKSLVTPCIDFKEAYSKVELTACFLQGRMLKTSGIPYSLAHSVNDAGLVIDVNLGIAGRTLLELYSLTGEKVMTLNDSFMNAGTYQFTTHINSLSSGLYYIAMHSGIYSTTSKVVIKKQ